MLQNLHGLPTFDKVHNPLCLPRETTSERPKVARACGVFNILTWKCASRHSGVHFFDIATSKSGPNLVCFVHFDLEMCFVPRRRALLRHRSFQKWSERVVFLGFSLATVFRATTACTFSTSQLPKVVRTWGVFSFFTCKCASRHNGMHFFDISTSKSGPDLVCFVHFDFEMCFAPLASWLRTRRFGEPTFRPSGASNQWKKTQCFATSFLPFRAPASSFFWDFLFLIFFLLLFSSLLFSDSSHLCFSSVHIVGSVTSQLPSIITSIN